MSYWTILEEKDRHPWFLIYISISELIELKDEKKNLYAPANHVACPAIHIFMGEETML